MKPTLRKITPSPQHSFTVRNDKGSAMINNWHYHPEIELLYIKQSSGTCLIGDHTGYFHSGSLVLLGRNLPHCYKHDAQFLEQDAGESICLLFNESIFGHEFLRIPETESIRCLLQKSCKGLKIVGRTQKKCAKLLDMMLGMSPASRLITLIEIFNIIYESKEYFSLSSGTYTTVLDSDQEKIKKIFDYTLSHFYEKISLDHVASLINMTRYSFCRFFKRKTKKTYVQFLMEIRIGTACKLLVEEEKNVAEVCYRCGFNNLSHFHTHFKKLSGKKPLEYKRSYLNSEQALEVLRPMGQ